MSLTEQCSKKSQELKKYKISISGYGGESAYISISKAACEFWIKSLENGENNAVEYCLNADGGDFDFDDISEVPVYAQFLLDEDTGLSDQWSEASDEIAHLWGPSVQFATIDVDRIDDIESPDTAVENLISNEGVDDVNVRISNQTDFEVDAFEEPEHENISYPNPGDCVFMFTSLEKGTFFEGFVSSPEEFDLTKMRFVVAEAPDGEDIILGMKYDGQVIENLGGDTKGQGYEANAWQQQ